MDNFLFFIFNKKNLLNQRCTIACARQICIFETRISDLSIEKLNTNNYE